LETRMLEVRLDSVVGLICIQVQLGLCGIMRGSYGLGVAVVVAAAGCGTVLVGPTMHLGAFGAAAGRRGQPIRCVRIMPFISMDTYV